MLDMNAIHCSLGVEVKRDVAGCRASTRMREKIILPLGELGAIADDLFSRQTPILCDGREARMEIGQRSRAYACPLNENSLKSTAINTGNLPRPWNCSLPMRTTLTCHWVTFSDERKSQRVQKSCYLAN